MSDVFSIELKKGIRVMARFNSEDDELEILDQNKNWVKVYSLNKTQYNALKYSIHDQGQGK
jgi:hypothetical protein